MDANSLAVIAFGQENSFLHAPDVYMEKIVIGPNLPNQLVDLDNSVKTNLENLAKAKKCAISDLCVMILTRDRHQELIAKTREAGARVKLFGDGDIAASINTCQPSTGVDMYIGTGGAPEGVLTAAALKTCGGQIMGRLIFGNNQRQIDRAKKMGITDLNKKYTTNDMAKGDVLFAASGVTDGNLVDGIKITDTQIITQTLLMYSKNNTIQTITTKFLK
jgi:fructose-1,6-bisphosphatase II / sedoheptulose-1,7-bisphosphatase